MITLLTARKTLMRSVIPDFSAAAVKGNDSIPADVLARTSASRIN